MSPALQFVVATGLGIAAVAIAYLQLRRTPPLAPSPTKASLPTADPSDRSPSNPALASRVSRLAEDIEPLLIRTIEEIAKLHPRLRPSLGRQREREFSTEFRHYFGAYLIELGAELRSEGFRDPILESWSKRFADQIAAEKGLSAHAVERHGRPFITTADVGTIITQLRKASAALQLLREKGTP